MSSEHEFRQHTPGVSLGLHLFPGVLIGIFYFTCHGFITARGFPSIMVLMLSVVVVLIPVELGILLYQARKKSGTFSLTGIVAYLQPIRKRWYLVLVPGLFIIIGLVFTMMRPVDEFLQRELFSWMPSLDSGLGGGYTKNVLILTYGLVGVFGVVIGPLVEELYFRGFLLPRMQYAGRWAPLLHSLLFAIYHVFTPWMIVTRTIGMLPLIFAVKRKNLFISIIVHILVNSIDLVAGLLFIVNMG